MMEVASGEYGDYVEKLAEAAKEPLIDDLSLRRPDQKTPELFQRGDPGTNTAKLFRAIVADRQCDLIWRNFATLAQC